VRELAQRWIALAHKRGYHTQPELRMLGLAHLARGELEQAVDAFEGALAAGGPQSDVVREELDAARARLAQQRAGGERRDGAQAE
jgi:hypothetical protein